VTADVRATDTVPPPTLERVLRDGFEVSVVDGPDRGAFASSRSATLVVGTDPTCDLVLTCRAVSRFHCEIELAPDGATIRDLGSTNGTRVDGVRVLHAFLRRGAEVELGRDRLRFELAGDKREIEVAGEHRFGRLIGASVAMREVFARLARAADSSATVLLLGETGTGKDTAAEAIHRASARAGGPFVTVDCGALPGGLVESELFGHCHGAFTGADRDRLGVFEAAHGGTLFLDEIGELPLLLQPKLLRVLERREVQRVGESFPRPVDVRVIAATNRDLRREVNRNRFRPDLYFRLAVVPITLPALRDRPDDIPLIANALLDELVRDGAARARLRKLLDGSALMQLDWPGNVRELRNHIEQLAVLEHDPGGDAADAGDVPFAVARDAWQRAFERRYLRELLVRSGGDIVEASRRAGMHKSNLYRLLQRAGLS